MAFGAEHVEPAGLEHPRLLLRHFLADARDRGVALRPLFRFAEFVGDAEVDIAAELNVRAAARHVGGDGDRAHPARLGHNMRFLLVEAGVQNGMLDAFLLEIFGEHLRLFD